MSQPESRLSRAIKAAIRAGGGYCVKIHGGPTMEAGTPDILACIPVDIISPHHNPVTSEVTKIKIRVGLFVGIETKMPGKENTVSLIQAHRHEQIRKSGGVVIVPTSVQEAVAALDALGWCRTPPDGP